MTFRAVNVLKTVEIVAAEDTRHTHTLLSRHGIAAKRLVSLHEHNEAARIDELIAAVQAGASLAIVSDAGTPLISDPGTLLVRAAWRAGVRLVPVPGSSSVTALLSVSPFGAIGFELAGFVPAKPGPRDEFLLQIIRRKGPGLFFETPHRMLHTLEALRRLAPERRLLVGRELTKLHEQLLLGRPEELLPQLTEEHRGEFVCLLEGGADDEAVATHALSRTELIDALKGELSPRALARVMARLYGEPAREVYKELMSRGQTVAPPDEGRN